MGDGPRQLWLGPSAEIDREKAERGGRRELRSAALSLSVSSPDRARETRSLVICRRSLAATQWRADGCRRAKLKSRAGWERLNSRLPSTQLFSTIQRDDVTDEARKRFRTSQKFCTRLAIAPQPAALSWAAGAMRKRATGQARASATTFQPLRESGLITSRHAGRLILAGRRVDLTAVLVLACARFRYRTALRMHFPFRVAPRRLLSRRASQS